MKKDLKGIKQDSFWANLFLFALFPYSFLTGLSSMQGVHIIYPAFAFSVFIFIFIGITCKNKQLFKTFLFIIVFVLLFLLLNMILVGNSDIKNIVYGAFIMPALGALLFFYRVRYWVALVLFYGVALFFGAYIIENGPFVNEETELLVNSRNYVSYFVILYSLPYFVHCYDYNKIPSLIVPLICVLIAIFALGRSGILVSMGMLAGVLYLKMTQKSRIKILYRFAFFSLVLAILIIGVSGDFIDTYFSKFSEEGMNSSDRTLAWWEYTVSMINPINLLLGTPIDSLAHTKNYLEGSLHNSYFTLLSREGIVGLVIVIYMLKGFWSLYKQKCYPLFIIMAVLLFKGLTDADMGGIYSGGDIYVFYLVLVYFYFRKDKKNERKNIGVVPTAVSSNSGE